MEIAGSCHCGNITFSLAWPDDSVEIPARSCGCTFCCKHGGVWTSNPRAALHARISTPAAAARYAFGTESAAFIVCTRCGVVPLEDLAARLARRRRHWIADVHIVEGVP